MCPVYALSSYSGQKHHIGSTTAEITAVLVVVHNQTVGHYMVPDIISISHLQTGAFTVLGNGMIVSLSSRNR